MFLLILLINVSYRNAQLLYFGTQETGLSRSNLQDLFPYNEEMKATLAQKKNKKLCDAIKQADQAISFS